MPAGPRPRRKPPHIEHMTQTPPAYGPPLKGWSKNKKTRKLQEELQRLKRRSGNQSWTM